MVNTNHIMDVLGKILKVFKQKRPVLAAGASTIHWDNDPVHTR
jgi:hypothetical protein